MLAVVIQRVRGPLLFALLFVSGVLGFIVAFARTLGFGSRLTLIPFLALSSVPLVVYSRRVVFDREMLAVVHQHGFTRRRYVWIGEAVVAVATLPALATGIVVTAGDARDKAGYALACLAFLAAATSHVVRAVDTSLGFLLMLAVLVPLLLPLAVDGAFGESGMALGVAFVVAACARCAHVLKAHVRS